MSSRDQTIAALDEEIDVIIVGGGINGAVSAAALAAHGVRVVLLEANDFASMTSQESSNMIWGGIKYLQDYEFSLVWALCRSRNQLLKKYPNRVKQIPFFAVIGPTSPFSRWLGFLGSILYWFFGRFKTSAPRIFSNAKIAKLNPALNLASAKGAIQYNDAILLDNDARFVWEFIKSASANGARVLNYVEVISATATASGWDITAKDKVSGATYQLKSSAIVNATGPYAQIITENYQIPTSNKIVISKGVHLIVPRIETGEKVLAFFDDRGRLFYVLPMHDRTVIGTTDTQAAQPEVDVTDEDREFLLAQANRCLKLSAPLTKADIIAERCGVRPLVITNANELEEVDWISLSRKHVVELRPELRAISIFGGKLTDCINVGYEVVELVKKLGIKIAKEKSWIGEPSATVPASLINDVTAHFPTNAEMIATEIWRRHGEQSAEILKIWQHDPSSVALVFPGLGFTYGELQFIAENEYVVTSDDLLRRRTPIALLRRQNEIASNEKLSGLLASLKKI